MKIAVVGCGAVGSFYGAKLARAGAELHFLLRSDYEVVRRHGVRIQSPQGDFQVRPKCALTPQEIGPCDLVLIGLKTTANAQFNHLLPGLIGEQTAVVTLQNGLGNEEQIARVIAPERILGGLCFVCLNRLEAGLVQHIAHGQVILGEFQRWPEPRTHDIATLFRHAGVPCSVTDNLARAHWEKLTWNIPFNGLGVASIAGYEAVTNGILPDSWPSVKTAGCLTTAELLAEPRWANLVCQLIGEVIATARGLGFELPDALADKQIERTRTMGAYKASTLIDFERGQAIELESLFLEPLRHAQLAGVSVPRLQGLCRVLQQLDALRLR
jgi:2-dehydropantoate 2-reductase